MNQLTFSAQLNESFNLLSTTKNLSTKIYSYTIYSTWDLRLPPAGVTADAAWGACTDDRLNIHVRGEIRLFLLTTEGPAPLWVDRVWECVGKDMRWENAVVHLQLPLSSSLMNVFPSPCLHFLPFPFSYPLLLLTIFLNGPVFSPEFTGQRAQIIISWPRPSSWM